MKDTKGNDKNNVKDTSYRGGRKGRIRRKNTESTTSTGLPGKIANAIGLFEAFDMPAIMQESKGTLTSGATAMTVGGIAEALIRYNGMQTVVARSLGVTPRMLQKYIANHPTLQEIVSEIDNTILDYTENKLMEKVSQGDMKAILFVLKCKGRNRGWIEMQESTVTHNIPQFVYSFKKGSTIPLGPGRPQPPMIEDSGGDVVDMEVEG